VSEQQPTAVLDVRRESEYIKCHRLGTANIPLEELADRIHELPPPFEPLIVFDADRRRASRAAELLRGRGRDVTAVEHGDAWLDAGETESGPCQIRLWRCHPLLVEALRIAHSEWATVQERTALDIACGTGRDAVHLALAGFRVDAVDILPDALERCRELARRNRVCLETRCVDVETHGWKPDQSYDLVCCFNFLHRPLMPAIADAVHPGGFIVYETFVQPQREVYGKPTRDNHILRRGELQSFFPGWTTCVRREGETGPRRIAASLIARKPSG
jgi:tellurite methyltransferase